MFRQKNYIHIDPCNMTYEQSCILGTIILCAHAKGITKLSQGLLSLTLDDPYFGKVAVDLDLTSAIVIRGREHHPDEIRGEILDVVKVGSGGFSTAYKVSKTLIPQTDGSLKLDDKDRFTKHTDNTKKKESYVEQEYQHANLIDHLHVKRPVYEDPNDRKISFMFGKFLHGGSLYDHLQAEYNDPKLSTDTRLRLALELIRALQTQFHNKDIVHRDVKSSNVIVNLNVKSYPLAHYIDAGLSKIQDEDDSGYVMGTSLYMAPEVWKGKKTTIAADIYALGVMLSEVFRAGTIKKPHTYEKSLDRKLPALFSDITDLTRSQQRRIRAALKKMCANAPESRGSLTDAAAVFDEVRFEILKAKTKESDRDDLQFVHDLTAKLRDNIDTYCARSGKWNLNTISQEVERALIQFSDDIQLVREFVTVLGIREFYNLTTKEEISSAMDAILTNVALKRNVVSVLLSEFSKIISGYEAANGDPLYLEYLRNTFNSCTRRSLLVPASVDDTVILAKKIGKDISKIKEECDVIRHIMKSNLPAPVRPLPNAKPPLSLNGFFAPAAQSTDSVASSVAEKEGEWPIPTVSLLDSDSGWGSFLQRLGFPAW